MGVLGGMGVYATINFITQFINKFKVNKEWEYPKYIIHCNPQLPSRSRHIFYNEESPLKILKEDIIHLNSTNIDFIVIPESCSSSLSLKVTMVALSTLR